MEEKSNILKYKSLGIYTQNENVVYMREDCHVCISEGFEALTRIRVSNMSSSIIASLHIITSEVLRQGEIGLSQIAAKKLKVWDGETLYVSHLEPIESLSFVRAKIYNQKLGYTAYKDIITDIIEGDYSNIHLSAFITACAGDRMDIDEISDLTKAMISSKQSGFILRIASRIPALSSWNTPTVLPSASSLNVSGSSSGICRISISLPCCCLI